MSRNTQSYGVLVVMMSSASFIYPARAIWKDRPAATGTGTPANGDGVALEDDETRLLVELRVGLWREEKPDALVKGTGCPSAELSCCELTDDP